MKSKDKAIRRLNDEFRKGQSSNSKVYFTSGVVQLGDAAFIAIHNQVMAFDGFTEDNDPYGEHDFGSFVFGDETIYWKIDYYNLDMNGGSENPADPDVTQRVLTIMLASEY